MSTHPPGWYPDPHGGPSQRYWDGQQWTEHSAAPAGPPQGAPPPPSSADPYGQSASPGASYGQPAYAPPGVKMYGGHVLAGWWSRVGGAIIDGLILLVPVLIVGVAIGAYRTGEGSRLGLQFASSAVGLAIAFGYYAWTMTRSGEHNGQSLGHQAAGIRVIRTDGRPVDVGLVLVRQTLLQGILFGWLSWIALGIPWLLNYLWPLWDKEARALHDMMANTRVVKA